ncbi:MAG: hypothetical protein EXR52_00905 [Dehalococcoidia bacterium]|nr:hypothetical protein [Dehalococcoidia bacterium]
MRTHEDVVVLRFSGPPAFQEGDLWFVACNEAPIVGCGASKEEEHVDMSNALLVYVESLAKIGEFGAALTDGRLSVAVTVEAKGDVHVNALPAVAALADSWLLPLSADGSPAMDGRELVLQH